MNLFFSYSHKDEALRNELDKHLSILKRQGLINAWHDRRITAGSELDLEISNHLENANIILLLVSADFLASEYCYDKEMKKAIEMHKSSKAVVIPVILRPCDWHDTPFGKLAAIPKDGKPVTKFTNLDDAFLEITNEIKRALPKRSTQSEVHVKSTLIREQPSAAPPRSSNLKIKKAFSDKEKDQFLDDAFEYISNYFEESLNELKKRNPVVDTRFKRIDLQTVHASVYINGQKRSECMIFYGSSIMGSKSINYSSQFSHSRNSLNESLSIEDDGYMLYLKPIGMFYKRQTNDNLTFEGAAEFYWNKFIEPLQNN